MNITWHIIKKDLFHSRWSLVIGLGCFALLLFSLGNVTPAHFVRGQDFVQIFTPMLIGLFSIGFLAELVQQDHPNTSSGFWRTRPISATRLVAAKLLLVGGVFIVLPLAALSVRNHFSEVKNMKYLSEYFMLALMLSSLTFSLVAAATCTKNTIHCVLLWAGVILATGALAELLGRFAPTLNRQIAMQMNVNRMLAVLVLSTTVAVAIIINQYVRRRLTTSIVLFFIGSVGSALALIGSMWGYYYSYHS